jgi:hypothetical protein
MPGRTDDRSLGDLFSELSRETGLLVRKEIELATTETTAKLNAAATYSGGIAAGGVLAHAGVLILLAGLVLGIAAMGVPAWLSAVIVGVGVMTIGYVVVSQNVAKMKSASFAPTRTINSLKEAST